MGIQILNKDVSVISSVMVTPKANIGSIFGTTGWVAPIDDDAAAFFSRVTAAGGTLTTTEQTAVETLVSQLKSFGIWNSMRAIYPMVGSSAAACAQNLKSASFTGTFASGWTFSSTGATPNGAGAYMDTGFVPSSFLSNSTFAHLSYYSRTDTALASEFVMGSSQSGGGSLALIIRRNNNLRNFLCDFTSATYRTASDTNSLNGIGYFLGNQQGLNCKLIINNVVAVQNSSVSLGLSPNSLPTFLGSTNLSGAPGFYTNKQCAFSTIGDGLTDMQASNLYTAVQAFQTTLGRQV